MTQAQPQRRATGRARSGCRPGSPRTLVSSGPTGSVQILSTWPSVASSAAAAASASATRWLQLWGLPRGVHRDREAGRGRTDRDLHSRAQHPTGVSLPRLGRPPAHRRVRRRTGGWRVVSASDPGHPRSVPMTVLFDVIQPPLTFSESYLNAVRDAWFGRGTLRSFDHHREECDHPRMFPGRGLSRGASTRAFTVSLRSLFIRHVLWPGEPTGATSGPARPPCGQRQNQWTATHPAAALSGRAAVDGRRT
jgi:hypothetical protein